MRTHRRAVASRLALLFDHHASMVLGLCRLLLRDHHEAEDAAQQTFFSAYRSLLRGTEPRDPAPWLAAIARNECRARIRRRMRSPLAFEAEVGEQFPDPSDIVDQTERRAELAALTAAIAELPSRQREAVALRDFLGLSYEEVASTLSVSVPVVESLLFRARRRLRDTVRTVPRYAAGLVAIPIAVKATLSRDGDLDTVGSIGVAGAAGTALAAVVAKVVSLPFATKATTAVAVATMATVGPHIGGAFDGQSPPVRQAPVAAAPFEWPVLAAPAPDAGPAEAEASPKPASPHAQAGDRADAVTAPAEDSSAPSSAGPAAPEQAAPVKPDTSESAEETPAAEPEPVREVVASDEAPDAGAAPATDSEALPAGPDGAPIIGLEPGTADVPEAAPPAPAPTPPAAPATQPAAGNPPAQAGAGLIPFEGATPASSPASQDAQAGPPAVGEASLPGGSASAKDPGALAGKG